MIARLDPEYIKLRPQKALIRLVSHLFFQGRPLTTHFRQLNYLNAPFLKLITRLPVSFRIDRPVFITGTGRSGTTILGKILSFHKDVGFLNEPKLLWHIAFGNEDIIGNYTDKTAYYILDEKNADEKGMIAIKRMFRFYLMVTGTKRLVDKYPEIIFRVKFIKKIFPDAKIIFIIRNGWDTIQSVDLWSGTFKKKHGAVLYDWWGKNNRKWRLIMDQVVKNDPFFPCSFPDFENEFTGTDKAAVEWICAMRQGGKIIEWKNKDIFEVRYENLTNFPGKTLSEILNFCELEHDSGFLDYGKKILKKRKFKMPVSLHDKILPLFMQTMKELGYNPDENFIRK